MKVYTWYWVGISEYMLRPKRLFHLGIWVCLIKTGFDPSDCWTPATHFLEHFSDALYFSWSFLMIQKGCKAIKMSVNRNKVINILSVWIWAATQMPRTENPTSEGSLGFFLFTDFVFFRNSQSIQVHWELIRLSALSNNCFYLFACGLN